MLVAPKDITKYICMSIYIHKTFTNLLSEIYGFDWLADLGIVGIQRALLINKDSTDEIFLGVLSNFFGTALSKHI